MDKERTDTTIKNLKKQKETYKYINKEQELNKQTINK